MSKSKIFFWFIWLALFITFRKIIKKTRVVTLFCKQTQRKKNQKRRKKSWNESCLKLSGYDWITKRQAVLIPNFENCSWKCPSRLILRTILLNRWQRRNGLTKNHQMKIEEVFDIYEIYDIWNWFENVSIDSALD